VARLERYFGNFLAFVFGETQTTQSQFHLLKYALVTFGDSYRTLFINYWAFHGLTIWPHWFSSLETNETSYSWSASPGNTEIASHHAVGGVFFLHPFSYSHQ